MHGIPGTGMVGSHFFCGLSRHYNFCVFDTTGVLGAAQSFPYFSSFFPVSAFNERNRLGGVSERHRLCATVMCTPSEP